jgi:hypothetical protein
VSGSTNRTGYLRQIKANQDSVTNAEQPSESLDGIAELYNVKEVLEACRRLKREPSQQRMVRAGDCSSSDDPQVKTEYVKQDFTAQNGSSSKLKCPLATKRDEGGSKDVTDPISADIHDDGSMGSGTLFAMHNPDQCPIRFLDQHSPEEVAKYFEKHKHELPRSHAVCISSYQQDDAKVRRLDAKYGNLQNMIQSLGVKHQQYLPGKEREAISSRRSSLPGEARVQSWANNVAQVPGPGSAPLNPSEISAVHPKGQGERSNHFARSLRQIRLGESPSRPWGISVPPEQERAASASASQNSNGSLAVDSPDQDGTTTLGRSKKEESAVKRPIDSNAGKQERELPQGARVKEATPHPQMVFNGPVFFGYSSEQAAAMLQAGNFDPIKS